MIHEAYNKVEVALRYYKIIAPEREYTREQARKQLLQEKKFDFGVMKKVIEEVKREQIEMINAAQRAVA